MPFLLAFVCTAVVAGITHKSHYDPFMFIGELPIGGPGGNYFIALIFQYALLSPLIYWGLSRRPRGTLLVCLVVDLAFELIAPRMRLFADHPYLYSVCALRFLFLVALGGIAAGFSASHLLRSWWLWLGALVSAGYLGLLYANVHAFLFIEAADRGQAFIAAFYPLLLVVVGVRRLPSVARGTIARAVAECGRASYHIFLVQIIWFGAVTWAAKSWAALVPNLVSTIAIGLLFYRFTTRMPLPSATKLLAQRADPQPVLSTSPPSSLARRH